MNLAENILNCRKNMGMSQEDVAEKCNVSRQAVAKWERGESIPTLENVCVLADMYRMSLDELVGRADQKAALETMIARLLPKNLRFGEECDALAYICRLFEYLERYGFSATQKLEAMQAVFGGDDESKS